VNGGHPEDSEKISTQAQQETRRILSELSGSEKFVTMSNIILGGNDRRTERLQPSLDRSQQSPNDKAMTDLTRQEVDAKLAQNKAEVDARLANFDSSIKTGFAELRAEMAKQSGDLRTEMANVRAEMHKNTIDVIKWVIVTVLGVATATVSILTFVINNAAPKPAAQPGAQPTPIVITVPGTTPGTAPAAQK
jgi:hypothetical protein